MHEAEGEFLPPSATGRDADGYKWELSPDGSVRVRRFYEERRNNEVWDVCVAYPATGGKPIFSPPHFFDTDIAWTGPRNFAAFTGEAFGQGSIRIDIDVDAARGTVARTGKSFALKDADRAIRKAYEDYVRSLPPPPPMPPPPRPGPQPIARKPIKWMNVILALIVNFIFLACVALGSYLWHVHYPPEPLYPPPQEIKPVTISE